MHSIAEIQQALTEQNLDGWLLYDFRGLNILARRVVSFRDDIHLTRRWFYFIPRTGEPRKLVHRIESGALDSLPGSDKMIYLTWQKLEESVGSLVAGSKRIAMEYVPRNANPYASRVDGGTIELVKSFGVEIVSSGDLIQQFEATWDDEQWQMHLDAAVHTRSAFDVAFHFIGEMVKKVGSVRESAVQKRIMEHFDSTGLITDAPPIVAVGPHSGDPHYSPTLETDTPIRLGDFVLVDLWAKLDQPRSVYSDLTRTAFVGKEVPEKHAKVFAIVAAGRDAAIARVRDAFAKKEPLQGWQVDRACRDVIEKAGYGEYFVHRTGHSIGQETHGNGANMDDLETHEQRRVMPRTCFSVEPGIYLPEFGIRSETNVYIGADGSVHVTGGELQTAIHLIG